ncbi:MAG TPA: TIGR03560 family F420-dependent LLM class oxidoreductase [Chloroflexota bacterium]|nr:TIGR03560 family F420-dependent LLM class oxidoreductase [Chloroflexota bacterium]
MARVELGVHIGPQDIDLDELRLLWRRCDAAGFDLITVWDHFYESPPVDGSHPVFESIASLAALALETRRCRIGCLCFGMGYRNPALLAKSLTTIDHLSKGRLTVGLGAGWHEPEHDGYGFRFPPVKERMDRLSEGVRIVRALFTQERSTFVGEYYQVKDAPNAPRPVQERIPIIVGGGGERRTLRIAARWADGSNQAYISPEEYRHKNAVLDQWCEQLGRDPRTLERSVNVHFRMSSRGTPPAGAQPDGAISGSPLEVVDRLGQYVDAGAQRISLAIRPPVDLDALETFVDRVMPAFR